MPDFIIKLIAVFGTLGTVVTAILVWNKDKFKLRIDNDAIKRKEVADILQKLYDELKGEMNQQKVDHRKEITDLKQQHAGEIEKRDLIIHELIQMLPSDKRLEVEDKIRTIDINSSVL